MCAIYHISAGPSILVQCILYHTCLSHTCTVYMYNKSHTGVYTIYHIPEDPSIYTMYKGLILCYTCLSHTCTCAINQIPV